MTKTPSPLALVIGEQLAALREREGLRQEDVATVAAGWGFGWRRSTVAAIETGKRDLSLEELSALSSILRVALSARRQSGEVVTVELSDLIPDEAVIALGGKQTSGAIVKRMLAGKLGPTTISPEESPDSGEAEEKAARRLDVPPERLAAAASSLWGRSLTAERDARIAEESPPDPSPRTLQALRGHVTRRLLEELRSILGGGDDG